MVNWDNANNLYSTMSSMYQYMLDAIIISNSTIIISN